MAAQTGGHSCFYFYLLDNHALTDSVWEIETIQRCSVNGIQMLNVGIACAPRCSMNLCGSIVEVELARISLEIVVWAQTLLLFQAVVLDVSFRIHQLHESGIITASIRRSIILNSADPSPDAPESFSDLLNTVANLSENDPVCVAEILGTLGSRAYGPMLLLTSLLELFPFIGAIPGMYILVAMIVILLSMQIFVGRPRPWLPRRFREYSFSQKRLAQFVKHLKPWAARIDRLIRPRMTFLLRAPIVQLIALICIVLAILFFPFALIPSSEKVLVAPVFVFGLALTANDGLLAIVGVVVTIALMSLPFLYWDDFMRALPGSW